MMSPATAPALQRHLLARQFVQHHTIAVHTGIAVAIRMKGARIGLVGVEFEGRPTATAYL